MDNIEKYLELLMMVIGVFATIATMSGNKSANKFVAGIYKVINILAMNFGKSKNAPD